MRNDPLVGTHIESSRQSQAAWDRFASHWERVTALVLEPLASGGRSLCVLGAGNALHLGQVFTVANDLDLVDLDGQAMTEALHRHDLQSDHRIGLHGCDVSGLLQAVPGEADERNLVVAIDNHALPLMRYQAFRCVACGRLWEAQFGLVVAPMLRKEAQGSRRVPETGLWAIHLVSLAPGCARVSGLVGSAARLHLPSYTS